MKATAILLLSALVAVAGMLLLHAHVSYAAQDRDHISEAASALHWAGTDELGRDRAVRIAGALLLGLAGAVMASALATSLAVGFGLIAAFAHPFVANSMLYCSDLFLTLPWLFLLMIVRSTLPLTMSPFQSAALTFLLLGLLGWPVYTRVTYGGALAVRNAEWLVHGRAAGLSAGQLVRKHLMPHLMPLLRVQFLVCIPVFLMGEANLGALGLGVNEPLPSWGSMLLALQNSAMLASSRWVYLPILLLVTVLFLLEMLVLEV
jgi:ABC-type dipeptide/oligopeptide/nickel transport system permease subunit